MLYQEVRPKTLADVVGNTTTVSTIKNMLANQANMSKCHLFIGPAGCGKTTLAWIIARGLGCDESYILLYDAANTRGIETAREIEAEAAVRPLVGTRKVFILDESHQLTGPAQQALLGPTEGDAKNNAVFIFCTTDPQGIIPTLRSRLRSEFRVKPIDEKTTAAYLTKIVTEYLAPRKRLPKWQISSGLIAHIAKVSEGSLRSALTGLELALNASTAADAMELVKEGDFEFSTEVKDICKLLLSPAMNKVSDMQLLASAITGDAESFRRGVTAYLSKCLDHAKAQDVVRIATYISDLSGNLYSGGLPQLKATLILTSAKK
jgi:DNA polymerase III gamma/tau subunit